MIVLTQRNWEDVCCPGCRSELRVHPADIERIPGDTSPTRYVVDCPICSYFGIDVYPPLPIAKEIARGWPRCSCEGKESKATDPKPNWRCLSNCDWRIVDYTPPPAPRIEKTFRVTRD